jgi:hypothetical protein
MPPSNSPELPAGDPWESATYAGAERAQLRDGMRLSMDAKLRWLEETWEFASTLKDSTRRPPPSSENPTP